MLTACNFPLEVNKLGGDTGASEEPVCVVCEGVQSCSNYYFVLRYT